MENPPITQQQICKSCGNCFTGKYCNQCGEKIIEARDLSIRHYLEELVHALTSADTKLWRTIRLIVGAPGQLSRAYMEGRRTQYLKPLSIFFLANLIYFLIPLFETFNSSLYTQMNALPHSRAATRIVNEYTGGKQMNLEEFRTRYEAKSTETAKLLLIVLVFLISIPVGLANRQKHPYVAGHITFAFEIITFNLLVNSIALGALTYFLQFLGQILGWDTSSVLNDRYITVVVALTIFYFLFAGEQAFYGCTRLGSLWRALVIIAGMFAMLTVYRILLFFITFSLIR